MPGPMFRTTARFVDRAEQTVYRADTLNLKEMRLFRREGAREIAVNDLWYEEPIGDDWIAAFRMVYDQNKTRVVVGELRVFPSAGPREPYSGRWIAEVLGIDAPVPPGGLRSREVVKKVRLRGFESKLNDIFEQIGFPKFAKGVAATRGRRGPKIDELRYARVAEAYSRAYLSGSAHPTRDMARALSIRRPATARAAVARARKLGFLEETKQGERGGRLTQRGLNVLAEHASSKGRRS